MIHTMNEQNSLLYYFSPDTTFHDKQPKKGQIKYNKRNQNTNKDQTENSVLESKYQNEIIKIIDPRIYATGLQMMSEIMGQSASQCSFIAAPIQDKGAAQNIFYQHQCGGLQLLYLDKQQNGKRSTLLKMDTCSTFFKLQDQQLNINDPINKQEIINLQLASSGSETNITTKSSQPSQKVVDVINQPLEKNIGNPIQFMLDDEIIKGDDMLKLILKLMEMYKVILLHIPCDNSLSPFVNGDLKCLEQHFLVHKVGNISKIVTLLIINELNLNLQFDLFKYTQFLEIGVKRLSNIVQIINESQKSENAVFPGFLSNRSLGMIQYATTGPELRIQQAQLLLTIQSLDVNQIFKQLYDQQLGRMDILVIDLGTINYSQVTQQLILNLRPLFDFVALCSPNANQAILDAAMKQYEHLDKYFVTSRLLLVSTKVQFLRFEDPQSSNVTEIEFKDREFNINVQKTTQDARETTTISSNSIQMPKPSLQAEYDAAKRFMQVGNIDSQVDETDVFDNNPQNADEFRFELERGLSELKLEITQNIASVESQIREVTARVQQCQDALPNMSPGRESIRQVEKIYTELRSGITAQENAINEIKKQVDDIQSRLNGLFQLLGEDQIIQAHNGLMPSAGPLDDVSALTGGSTNSIIAGRQKSQYSILNVLKQTEME